MATSHPLATGGELHKPFRYEGAFDPGAVGAGWYWVDTSSTPMVLRRRNNTNNGWDVVSSLPAGGSPGQALVLSNGAPYLSPPVAPSLSQSSGGGSVAAGVYTVKVTYVNTQGETLPSQPSSVTTTGATSTITIASPIASGLNTQTATGWYAYVTQAGGSTYTRQQGSPTNIGTSLTLTVAPTNTGPIPPTSNTAGTAVPTWTPSSGGVTSVGIVMPSDFTVTGSPVTSSGTIAITPTTQAVNTFKAGPVTGSAAAPTYRVLDQRDLPQSPTLTGQVTGQTIAASGVTGAGAECRVVGATSSGAPLTGTFAVGDVVVDLTGKFWICTGAGTPGTWAQASSGMSNPMTANQDMIVGGSSGLPARLAIGANGQVLGIAAGVVGWINNPSGFTNPMTQPGDMIYGSTAGSPLRLPNGANGQVLTIIAGLPGWANPTGGAGGVSNNVSSALYLARTCI